MSYAASVAKDTLTEAELERYSLSFRNYSAISVREKNAVEILQPASPIKIQWVLDPVFLLGRKKWDSLGGDKKIKKKYVFCYSKNRQEFIASLKTGSFSDSVDKYCSIPFSERVHTKIKLIIKKISRRK